MKEKDYNNMSITACLYALSFGAHADEQSNISLEPIDHSLEPIDHSLEPNDHSLEPTEHSSEPVKNIEMHTIQKQQRQTFRQRLELWQQRVCQFGKSQDNATFFDELKTIHDDMNRRALR